jgi:hypothetical protein
MSLDWQITHFHTIDLPSEVHISTRAIGTGSLELTELLVHYLL